MDNVIILNPGNLEKKIEKFRLAGKDKIHVISDFDRTLTKAFVNGKKTPSVIAILRNGNYLDEEYTKKANELANKYHPIEIDPNVPDDEKRKAMFDWWSEHFDLLIHSDLNRKDIENVVNSGEVELRKGCVKFFDLLHEYKIPLIIFSAGGLGCESISGFLEKENRHYNNISIISNGFEWDENGRAISFHKPIIHVFNKDETVLPREIYEKVKNRKNVFLLGDSLGDLGMVEGFDYDGIIRVGFYNEDNGDLENYKSNFDIVLTGDSDFEEVNKLFGRFLK